MKFVVTPIRRIAGIALAVVLGAVLSAGNAHGVEDGPLHVECANGIRATVFTPEYLMSKTVFDGTRGTIDIGGNVTLHVVTDIEDPIIANKGDGAFHPFPIDNVLEQMHEIHYSHMQVDIEVFVLPFPRSNVLVSSTSGNRVFLSPHVYQPSDASVAYIVAHEFGHVFQNRYLPYDDQTRWQGYRSLRGIENETIYHAGATHANRPVEIFAEDFRVLYGSELAHFDGRIENTSIQPPSMVPGLYSFFAQLPLGDVVARSIVSVNSYPNPFNPTTELHVSLSGEFYDTGDAVSVRIYDVRGAMVRELLDSRPASSDFRLLWDGRDDAGNQVASSTYFGVIQAGEEVVSRKLSMIK